MPDNPETKKKILLAVGDTVILDIISKCLMSWNYDVIPVNDHSVALQTVKKEHPDLVIVDTDISSAGGLRFCKVLKEDFTTSYIPIIVLIKKIQLRQSLLEIKEGVDDYLVKPPDPIDLLIRIEMALRSSSHQFMANSLTRLPGNKAIEKIVNEKIKSKKIFSFVYFDINNFKSFNDKYGYVLGDSVILQTARIITNTVKRYGNKEDFLGHIGGDDFALISTPAKENIIASETIAEFERLIPLHYKRKDRQKGYIMGKNRLGKTTKIPIMSLTVPIVNNRFCKFNNILEITQLVFEIKKYLKQLPGSNYLVNRRLGDYGIEKREKMISKNKETIIMQSSRRRRPLGQVLRDLRVINDDQLNQAVTRHLMTGELLGRTLLSLNLIERGDLDLALKNQEAGS